MSERARRNRGAVNYSEQGQLANNGVPAWARAQGLDLSYLEVEKKAAKGVKMTGDKENASGSDTTKSSGKDKAGPSGRKDVAQIDKGKKPAARGRNAGVVVDPIGKSIATIRFPFTLAEIVAIPQLTRPSTTAVDHKKSKHKGGSSKDKQLLAPSFTAPKQVPGLAGVTLKPTNQRKDSDDKSWSSDDSDSPSPANPAAGKRQKTTTTGALPAANTSSLLHSYHQQQTVRVQPTTSNPLWMATAAPPPPSAAAAAMSDPTGILRTENDRLRSQIVNLQTLLETETSRYTALKQATISEDVQALFERHNMVMAEHSKSASDLASQWKSEAQRMTTLAGDAPEVKDALTRMQAELHTTQQALLDTKVAETEKDKTIAELKERNTYLERWARVPQMENKCIGTDGTGMVNAAVQAPSWPGVHVMQARAMVPEGGQASSYYLPVHYQQQQRQHSQQQYPEGPAAAARRAMDASYSLGGQRTVGVQSASDMVLDNNNNNNVDGAELLRANARVLHKAARRASMSAAGATGQSLVMNGGGGNNRRTSSSVAAAPAMMAGCVSIAHQLPPVIEEEDGPIIMMNNRAGPSGRTGLSHSSIQSAHEEALQVLAGFSSESLREGGFRYIHRGTGYTFELRPAALGDNEDESEADDLEYRMVQVGAAGQVLSDYLFDTFVFAPDSNIGLLRNIMTDLARLNARR